MDDSHGGSRFARARRVVSRHSFFQMDFRFQREVMMRKYICMLLSAGIVFAASGCSSTKDKDDWQQYRAKKGQEEMSADVAKQKAEAPEKK
jgi:hypothetical protein